MVLWLTGLPASGKTTLADAIAASLGPSRKIKILDGDELRQQLPQLGYSRSERIAHAENVAKLASDFEKLDHVVIVALISPYAESRQNAKRLCSKMYEIYVSTPLEVCIKRDPKGLYKKALNNEILHFTGVSDPYEIPQSPDLSLDTSVLSLEECVKKVSRLFTNS